MKALYRNKQVIKQFDISKKLFRTKCFVNICKFRDHEFWIEIQSYLQSTWKKETSVNSKPSRRPCPDILGKAILSDVCFSSKSLPSSHQMVYKPSLRGLVLFLDVSCASRNLSLQFCWLRWFSVPDRGHFSEFKESPSGGVFSNRWNLQVEKCDA